MISLRNKNIQKISFLIVIFIFFVFLMEWCGISLLQLILLSATLFVQFLFGIILLKPIDSVIESKPLKILLSWILGVSVFGIAEFVLIHKNLYEKLFIHDLRYISWILLGICIVIILIKIKYIK